MRARRTWALAVGVILAGAAAVQAAASDWPGLRGPAYDGAAREGQLLSKRGGGLAVGWKVAVGSGYSAVAVADGIAVTMFMSGADDVIAAFAVDTGKEVWRTRIGEAYKGHDGSHDGPVSTPAIADGRVFGLDPGGDLVALSAKEGKEIWRKSLTAEFGSEAPHYGFSTSPIVVDGVLVVEVGGKDGKSIVGFDAATSKALWNAGDDAVEYQSPAAALVAGEMQVVAVAAKKLYGIAPRTGKVLWSYEHQGEDAVPGGGSMIPVPAGPGRFLLMNKSDSSSMLEVKRGKELDYEVREVWSSNSIRGSYVTPVYHDGHLYGISGRILTCVDAATGETKWRSREPGDGFPTLVGDQLAIITKPGTLHVVKAAPDAYQELASLPLFDEHSWSQVAFAGDNLFVRSMGHLARVDVVAATPVAAAAPAWLAATEFGRFLAELERAPDREAAVEAWLARQKSFPVIEGPDLVHFIYHGEATDVGIVGDHIGARREDPMTHVAGTHLFYSSARLEPDAAVLYGFLVDYGEPSKDPRNPRGAKGSFGDVSLLTMPAWRGAGATVAADDARRGRLEPVDWESKIDEGKTRRLQVYLPSGYDASRERRYPVAYVLDGKAALDDGGMANVLDRAIGDGVEPLVAVFIMPREDDKGPVRMPPDKYLEMLTQEIVPLVDGRFRTVADRSARASVGIGRTGGIALEGAMKHADLFARAGSLSGRFSFDPATAPPDALPTAEEKPFTLYVGWGTYDMRSPHEAWDLSRDNRLVFARLRERGYHPAGGEAPIGNGWVLWRERAGELFAALYPASKNAT